MEKLYFVDSIYDTNGEAGVDGDIYVNLICTYEEDGAYPTFYVKCKRTQLRFVADNGTVGIIEEGQYVYYEKIDEDNHRFRDGSNDPYALEQNNLGEELRQSLNSKADVNGKGFLTPKERKALRNGYVRSYHVNVGHGNCSLILIRGQRDIVLWMVDCSIVERSGDEKKWKNHKSELERCLNNIRKASGKEKLHIDRFFLTHMHYDHYSGVNYLIDSGYLTKDTVYYINHYYECNSAPMNSFLKKLDGINATLVEPVSGCSPSESIDIMHPEVRIYKKGKTDPNDKMAKREAKDANNASVVYYFNIGNRTMMYPGDLDKEGFKIMFNHYGEFNINYYAISHHGSATGHPYDISQLGIPKTYDHLLRKSSKAVLMGRDGSYNGIFDKLVLSYFDHYSALATTDMHRGLQPLAYLVLDWINSDISYCY